MTVNPFASRDQYVSQHLQTLRYPLATFTVDEPFRLPGGLRWDQVVSLFVPRASPSELGAAALSRRL